MFRGPKAPKGWGADLPSGFRGQGPHGWQQSCQGLRERSSLKGFAQGFRSGAPRGSKLPGFTGGGEAKLLFLPLGFARGFRGKGSEAPPPPQAAGLLILISLGVWGALLPSPKGPGLLIAKSPGGLGAGAADGEKPSQATPFKRGWRSQGLGEQSSPNPPGGWFRGAELPTGLKNMSFFEFIIYLRRLLNFLKIIKRSCIRSLLLPFIRDLFEIKFLNTNRDRPSPTLRPFGAGLCPFTGVDPQGQRVSHWGLGGLYSLTP